jgi:hypothetical protein
MLVGELGPDLTVRYSAALDNYCPSADVGHTSFDSTLLNWANSNKVSWTAWSWNPWGDCWSLVRNVAGAPTAPYGALIKSELAEQRQTVAP